MLTSPLRHNCYQAFLAHTEGTSGPTLLYPAGCSLSCTSRCTRCARVSHAEKQNSSLLLENKVSSFTNALICCLTSPCTNRARLLLLPHDMVIQLNLIIPHQKTINKNIAFRFFFIGLNAPGF